MSQKGSKKSSNSKTGSDAGTKRENPDGSFLDITMSDLDKTRGSFGVTSGPIGAGRSSIGHQRKKGSDALRPDENAFAPRQSVGGGGLQSIRAAFMMSKNSKKPGQSKSKKKEEEEEAEQDEDSGDGGELGFSPNNLDTLEKGRSKGRKTLLGKSHFGKAYESLDSQHKINVKNIASQMKRRFMSGQTLESRGTEVETVNQVAIEDEDQKQSIKHFVEKFGFAEMQEVDQLLDMGNASRKGSESKDDNKEHTGSTGQTTTSYSHHKIEEQDELAAEQEEAEQSKGETEEDDGTVLNEDTSLMFIEDIRDQKLLETEIVSSVNALLEGSFNATICSYAVSSNNMKIVIFGTESGELIECIMGEKQVVKKHTMESKVTAIAISPTDEYFVAGTQNSELLFKKTEGKLAKKQIKNLNQQKVTHLVFTDANAVLVGTVFNVYYFVISSYSLILEVAMTPVLPRQPSIIMQISTVQHDGMWKTLLVLNDKVSLYGITRDEKKEVIVTKIDQDIEDADLVDIPANNKLPPIIDWVLPDAYERSLRFIVFWNHKLSIYQFGKEEYVPVSQAIVQSHIAWGTVMNNKIICIANTNLEFEFLTIDRVFTTDFRDDGNHSKQLIHPGFLKDQRDLNYMTKYKDKLEDETVDLAMKLPFFQFFRNRIKETRGCIYLITDKGLFKHKLTTVDKIIEVYRIKGQHEASIKIMDSIFTGRMYVSPTERDAIRESAPGIVKSQVEKTLTPELFTDKQIEILQDAVHTLMVANCVEEIFDIIKPKFNQKLFWDEISKLIRSGHLKSIPYDHLASGKDYLDNEEIIQLLREFNIEDHKEDEANINKVLMIVKKKNIWPLLYKFCILSPNQSIPLFLTMLAGELLMLDKKVKDSIANEAIWTNPESVDLTNYFEEENHRLFFRIFWFFNLVLSQGNLEVSLPHFSDDTAVVLKNIPDIFAKTIEWILDGNNSKIILDTNSKMFFELVYECVTNMYLLRTQKVIEVVRKIKNISLKKNDNTNDFKFVANFRASQDLNIEPYPMVVAQNILMIFEEILEEKYKQDIAFVAIKLLHYCAFEKKNESQEWICCSVLSAMDQPYQHQKFWVNYKPVMQDKFEDLIISACNRIERLQSMDSMRKEITQKAYDQKYIRVYVAMVGNEVQLIDVFRLFLKNTTEYNSNYLFEWIRKCSNDPSVDKEELTEEVIKSIDRLVAWDKDKVREVVMQLPELGARFITALEAFPDLQLNYLDKMMQKSKVDQVEDNLKLKYLSLICQSQPDTVVMALKSYIFPLEESLKICEKYRNLHGLAYLKSRTRSIDEAIAIYIEIMKEALKKYMDCSGKPEELDGAIADTYFSYQMILEICKQEIEEMFDEGVKYFNQFTTFLFELYSEYNNRELELKKAGPSPTLERFSELKNFVKSEIFDDFLIVYITRVGTPGLIQIIKARLSNESVRDFSGLMLTLLHEKGLIHNITENSRLDLYFSKSNFINYKKSSNIHYPDCSVCGLPVHSKVILLSCPHPMCLLCAKDYLKEHKGIREPKDVLCPQCNTYQQLENKYNSCMSDHSQLSLDSLADKAIEEESERQAPTNQIKNKIIQLAKFDDVYSDLAKFQAKCENMIVSGNIKSLFVRKR